MVAPPGKKWKYDINDKSNMNKMEEKGNKKGGCSLLWGLESSQWPQAGLNCALQWEDTAISLQSTIAMIL